MESISIQVSPKQISKLRNGKKVRVKKAMEGGGINLLVEPSNYSMLTKTFSRNKGMELSLSPAEIMANREQAPSMQGQGIFGNKFDKKVEETIGRRGKKKVYGFAKDVLNPIAKTALYAGIASGATALSALQPELIPLILPAAAGTADFLGNYLDKPSDFYSKPNNVGGPKSRQAKEIGKQYLQQQALNQVNSQLGTNMGYLTQAGIGQAIQDKASQALNVSAIEAQRMLIDRINSGMENVSTLSPQEKELLKGTQYEFLIKGSGLYPVSGNGLYPASGNGLYLGRQGGSIVGRNGGFVHPVPQALQSQPLSTNYQFRYTLPVMMQKMIHK